MDETKPNTPAELTAESQNIKDEELDEVAGGALVEEEDLQGKASITTLVGRTIY